MQVAESQFSPDPSGCMFVLRKPIAKVGARKCRECGGDIFSDHSVSEVNEADLQVVLSVIADTKATEIEPGIFVGGFKAALAMSKEAEDIVVLNCAGTGIHVFLPKSKPGFDALRSQGRIKDLEWVDSVEFEIPINEVIDAIDWTMKQLELGKRVVVNCAQGKSRSGTMATAILMARNEITWVDALSKLQKARPFCEPNPAFLKQLPAIGDAVLEWSLKQKLSQ